MDPKKDIVYRRGKSKSVGPSRCLIVNSDNYEDPTYVSPGAITPPPAARVTEDTPRKVVQGVFTPSYSDEERTLIG